MTRVVYFVSSHGFGHAARAAAVIGDLLARRLDLQVTIFSAVPRWFFEASLGTSVRIEPVDVDVGLLQTDALTVDLAASLAELQRRIPFPRDTVEGLASRVDAERPAAVVCDIAPLGLQVAHRCQVPAVLVENFTWDWIYRGYVPEVPELAPVAQELESVFALADHRIQTEPVCESAPGARRVPPVSRPPRRTRSEVRAMLEIDDDRPFALVTMGGIEWDYGRVVTETSGEDPWLVILGGERQSRVGRVIRLPHESGFFHPDLIHAADVVVGKLGYSTLAEVWSAGVPLGYVPRPGFRESDRLERWARGALSCRRLVPTSFETREWLDAVGELLRAPRRPPGGHEGASAVARYLLDEVL